MWLTEHPFLASAGAVLLGAIDGAAILLLVYRSRGVEATLAWLFAVLALPGVGAVLYFLLANPRVRRSTIRRRQACKEVRETGCQRAILVGHNAFFDLSFMNAAIERTQFKRSPFHPFSCFDTVSLCGLAYGQTVLARSAVAAGMQWDTAEAHSAIYDTRMTAELFCSVVNRWEQLHEGVDAPIADGSCLPR